MTWWSTLYYASGSCAHGYVQTSLSNVKKVKVINEKKVKKRLKQRKLGKFKHVLEAKDVSKGL